MGCVVKPASTDDDDDGNEIPGSDSKPTMHNSTPSAHVAAQTTPCECVSKSKTGVEANQALASEVDYYY